MRIGPGVLALTMLAAAAGSVAAQAAGDFGRLSERQRVRVRTAKGTLFETRLGRGSPDSVSVLLERADVPIRAAEVDSLWVRGTAAGRGALIGLGVGLSVGLLGGYGLCAAAASEAGCTGGGLAALTLMGTMGGLMFGTFIGVASPRWSLRYARRGSVGFTPYLRPGRIGIAIRI